VATTAYSKGISVEPCHDRSRVRLFFWRESTLACTMEWLVALGREERKPV
jgi:hypothetical protein